MKKLQVFINRQGEAVAAGPAPEEIIEPSKTGPVFMGFAPADGGDDLTAYEIVVEDNFRPNGENVNDYLKRIGERVRATSDLKQVDFRKLLRPQR